MSVYEPPLFPSDSIFPSDNLFPSDGRYLAKGGNGMIHFTDKKLYLKGTCQAMLTDPCTGAVVYSSNKFQTGNITTSVTMGEVRAGMGNAIATILPSDSALNVEFNAADFNLWAKAAQMGAAYQYGAPAMECQTITASAAALSVDVSGGTPVAQVGFSNAFCYVQEVGQPGTVAGTGTPYPISASGAITGFTATVGTDYKVFYWVNKVGAQMASISSLFNPQVLHFTAQMPVFSNEACSMDNQGSRVGWLYVIVPRLKLGANGGVVGDQTTADTTSISGQAVAYDEDVVSAACSDCDASNLAYYIYVPDNGADQVQGLAVIGGLVTVAKSASVQIPVRFVMANGQLVVPNDYATGFTYTATGQPTGATVSAAGVVKAGTAAGDFEVAISYNNEGTTMTCPVNVTIPA